MYIVSPWEQMLAAGTKQGPSAMFPSKPWWRVLSMPTIHNISSSLGQDFVHVGQHQAPSSAEGVCVLAESIKILGSSPTALTLFGPNSQRGPFTASMLAVAKVS